jgi:hypothetical protein
MFNPAPQLRHLTRRIRWTLARWGRASVPALTRFRARAVIGIPGFLRWMRSILILMLWISFEAYIWGWEIIKRRAGKSLGQQANGWQRLVYCLALSLTGGQFVLLLLTRAHLSIWTMLLCAAHGLAVHIFWHRGVRWCKQQLGVRPTRGFDPQNPFAGLDLGID